MTTYIRLPYVLTAIDKQLLGIFTWKQAPMQDITAPAREEALVLDPPKSSQPRKRRFGVMAFGLLTILGLGVAGGANLHRLVDLNQAAPWLEHTGSILRSGFEAARREIGSRIASFTSKPVSVAQASQEATSLATPNNDIIERAVADLSLRVDQVRAAHDGSARDLGQGIERIRVQRIRTTESLSPNSCNSQRGWNGSSVSPLPQRRPRWSAQLVVQPPQQHQPSRWHEPIAKPCYATCARRKGEGGSEADLHRDETSPVWM